MSLKTKQTFSTFFYIGPVKHCAFGEISGSHGGECEENEEVSEVITASIITTALMGAVSTSETSVTFCETTRRTIPPDCQLTLGAVRT
jgi:hypothetical protein